jgi:hypothetical protein
VRRTSSRGDVTPPARRGAGQLLGLASLWAAVSQFSCRPPAFGCLRGGRHEN